MSACLRAVRNRKLGAKEELYSLVRWIAPTLHPMIRSADSMIRMHQVISSSLDDVYHSKGGRWFWKSQAKYLYAMNMCAELVATVEWSHGIRFYCLAFTKCGWCRYHVVRLVWSDKAKASGASWLLTYIKKAFCSTFESEYSVKCIVVRTFSNSERGRLIRFNG